jgi:hypothetical protein
LIGWLRKPFQYDCFKNGAITAQPDASNFEIALLIVKQLRTHQIAGILNDKISCDEEFYTF